MAESLRLKRSSSGRGRGDLDARSFLPSSTKPRSPSGRIRRGTTPSKTESPINALPPKPKFTAAQQIAIIEKVRSGNYKRGVGLAQFVDQTASVSKPISCKKNLAQKFQEEEMSSISTSAIPVEKNYSELPDYIKKFDEFFASRAAMWNHIMKMADAKSEAELGRLINPKQVDSVFKKLDQMTLLLEKFMKKPAWEIMALFQPEKTDTKTKKNAKPKTLLYCELKDQQHLIKALHTAGGLLERLDKVVNIKEPLDFTIKMEQMKTMLNSLEDELKTLSELLIDHEDLIEKEMALEPDDEDDAESTGNVEETSDESP